MSDIEGAIDRAKALLRDHEQFTDEEVVRLVNGTIAWAIGAAEALREESCDHEHAHYRVTGYLEGGETCSAAKCSTPCNRCKALAKLEKLFP